MSFWETMTLTRLRFEFTSQGFLLYLSQSLEFAFPFLIISYVPGTVPGSGDTEVCDPGHHLREGWEVDR